MLGNKSWINKICKINFRTLQIVHNVHDKSYEALLAVRNGTFVHQKQRHILAIDFSILAIEVYKSLMKTNPDFRSENNFLLRPAKFSGWNDVTSDKVKFRPDIRQNFFWKKNRTSRVYVALKTIWSYCTLINMVGTYPS